ncbi:MAG: hypothetical protein AB9873_16530 [Syntrophobacteraceae bacterium]
MYGISFLLVMVNQLVSELPGLVRAFRETGAHRDDPPYGRGTFAARPLVVSVAVGGALVYGSHCMNVTDPDGAPSRGGGPG